MGRRKKMPPDRNSEDQLVEGKKCSQIESQESDGWKEESDPRQKVRKGMGGRKEVLQDGKQGEGWVEGSDPRQKSGKGSMEKSAHRISAYTFARSLAYQGPVLTRQIFQ